MTKAELESKHLAELHALAADAGIAGYRMLRREELVERLAGDGESAAGDAKERQREPRRRPDRERRERRRRSPRERAAGSPEPEPEPEPEPAAPEPEPAAQSAPAAPSERPQRRRRRRFGRRGRKTVRVHELLLPPAPGRRTIVYAESRESCTALLRGVAGEIAGSKGPDPIALLIEPGPEELAEWRREAPAAEIVAAGQARHAGDALAQAARRAADGEDVIVLIDSLSRFAESFGGAEEAKDLFESGRTDSGTGSLTVVAAVEKS